MAGEPLDGRRLPLRFVGNVFFAFCSRLAPKIASTLLFILLMRQGGTHAAGTYSLSIAFLTSAVLFSSLGLDELIVREVAKEPYLSRRYLVNTLVLRGFFSLLGYAVVVSVVTWISNYDTEVQRIVLIQSLGLFPEGLNATLFAFFNARHKLDWMAFVSVCVSAFQLVAGGVALWMGAHLEWLIWILLTGSLLGVSISAYLSMKLLADQGAPNSDGTDDLAGTRRWQLGWSFYRQQIKQTLPFAIIIALVSLDLQLDVILLSVLRDVAEVGIYSAARTIVLFLSLVPQAFRMSIYPSMAKAYASSEADLRKIYGQSWRYLSAVGLPLTVGTMIVSQQVINLIYKEVPVTASWSLSILTLHLLVLFLYIPSARLMVVSVELKWLSLLLGVSLGFNLLLGILLVPWLGTIGTAISRSVASILYFVSTEFYVSRYLLPKHGGGRMAWKPLLSTVVMAIAVWSFRAQPLYVSVPLGVGSYSVATMAQISIKTRNEASNEEGIEINDRQADGKESA